MDTDGTIIFQSIGKTIHVNRRDISSLSEEFPLSFSRRNKDTEKLDSLVQLSNHILIRLRSRFTFFPDELIIDRAKISFSRLAFFSTGQVRSIAFEDIFDITVSYSPFFGKLEITDRLFPDRPIIISNIGKKEALLSRRVIQGLVIAKKEGVNLSATDVNELKTKAEAVGKARGG